MEIGNIIQGHWNEITGHNQDISQNRLSICYSCPIYSNRFGGLCNDKLWLNPNTGDVSTVKKEKYKNGCGCRLQAKTRLPDAKCPLGKW